MLLSLHCNQRKILGYKVYNICGPSQWTLRVFFIEAMVCEGERFYERLGFVDIEDAGAYKRMEYSSGEK